MAVDMFLKMDGIRGESADDKHKGEIDVLSFNWSVARSDEPGARGGPRIADFQIVKYVDTATPLLFQSVCSGEPIPRAYFTVRRAGSRPIEFLKITFNNVYVSEVAPAASSAGDGQPMDRVNLRFETAELEVVSQRADGSAGPYTIGTCGGAPHLPRKGK